MRHKFWVTWSHNGINVLEQYFIFTKFVQVRASTVNFLINSNNYTMRYYLVNSLYPKWLSNFKDDYQRSSLIGHPRYGFIGMLSSIDCMHWK